MTSVAVARADYGSRYRRNPYSRYVSPREIMALVPYWSMTEAEERAKVVSYFCAKYSKMCRDPMYDFGDFVALSYISVLMAKKNYEGKSGRLTPFHCRGYIKSYTRQEARKQETLKRLNILLANGEFNWIAIFTKLESYLSVSYSAAIEEENGKERDEPESIKRDLIDHILEINPCLHEFALDFFKLNGDDKKLKIKYGNTLSRQKKLFFRLSREFKQDRDADY